MSDNGGRDNGGSDNDLTNAAAGAPGTASAAGPGASSALPSWVLEVIRCPADTGELDVTVESLTCRTCGRRYPVRDGIPVLLVDEAQQS